MLLCFFLAYSEIYSFILNGIEITKTLFSLSIFIDYYLQYMIDIDWYRLLSIIGLSIYYPWTTQRSLKDIQLLVTAQ